MHEITINCKGGAMEVKVKGVKGPSCLQVTKDLEVDGEIKHRTLTPEYKEREQQQQQKMEAGR